jgi:hypothetical protein
MIDNKPLCQFFLIHTKNLVKIKELKTMPLQKKQMKFVSSRKIGRAHG